MARITDSPGMTLAVDSGHKVPTMQQHSIQTTKSGPEHIIEAGFLMTLLK